MSKRKLKRWRFHAGDRDQAKINEFARFARIPHVLAKLLVARGVEHPNDVARHLDPRLSHLYEPNLLPGCAAAAQIIHEAVLAGKKFAIYGDYDVDGMTATAILLKYLKLEGAAAKFYIPNRMDDGYGLKADSIQELHRKGAEVLITVDCGITAVEEVALAKKLGMTVIVTDHHQPAEKLPEADAIVHPDLFSHPDFIGNKCFKPLESDVFLREHAVQDEAKFDIRAVHMPILDKPYPFPHLSGAGVAFKLAWAICQRAANDTKVGNRRQSYILQALTLAAIGTVADVVPLREENRVIVFQGLYYLRQNPSVGMESLLKVAGLFDKNKFEADDIGFRLGPRLNAAGRLEQARFGVDLLTTEEEEQAQELAKYLDQLNEDRKSLERSTLLAATKQIKSVYGKAFQQNTESDSLSPPALVLADHDWHRGVIGIVAGKLAERYNCPAIMISLNKTGATEDGGRRIGTGSARGIVSTGFNLRDALYECRELLESFGGHAGAAGLRIAEENIEKFREAFSEVVTTQLTPEKRIGELWIDTEEMLAALTPAVVREIYRLAPFGMENPAPLFCTMNVTLWDPPRALGKQVYDGAADRPVSLELFVDQLGKRYRVVAFGFGESLAEFQEIYTKKIPIDIAFRATLNEFQGNVKVDIHLVDWRISET
ncbi:MAG: DHH family phosphoesterase [Planctomycetia bacterium]|nr:DHH family phosphoesterase [Planctomycetia bacterium]